MPGIGQTPANKLSAWKRSAGWKECRPGGLSRNAWDYLLSVDGKLLLRGFPVVDGVQSKFQPC